MCFNVINLHVFLSNFFSKMNRYQKEFAKLSSTNRQLPTSHIAQFYITKEYRISHNYLIN